MRVGLSVFLCGGKEGNGGKGWGKGRYVWFNVPKRLPIPVPDDADIGQAIPDLQRELVEVQIRVEEIALVLPPGLEDKVLAVRLGEEVLLSLRRAGRNVVLLPDVLAAALCTLRVHDRLAFFPRGHVLVPRVCGPCVCGRGRGVFLLLADAQHVDAGQKRAVQVGLVAVHVAFETRVDPPLDDAEGFVEQRRQAVADGVLEVVAEDELVARNVGLGHEGEGDGVAVVWVLRGGEVGRCGGGAFGETWVAVVRGWLFVACGRLVGVYRGSL